jgi:hypothetical protein
MSHGPRLESRRARRLRHTQNAEAHAFRIWARIFWRTDLSCPGTTWANVRREGRTWARLNRDDLTSCSGVCCGNPRRHFGDITIQERRFAARAAAELRCSSDDAD